jgi:hypothetical protein
MPVINPKILRHSSTVTGMLLNDENKIRETAAKSLLP